MRLAENRPSDLQRTQIVLFRSGIVTLVVIVASQIVEAMSKVWMRCTALRRQHVQALLVKIAGFFHMG